MEKNVTYYLRQKGLCFKNALSPLLLKKRAQIIVGQFCNHHLIFPKMLLLRVTTYFTLFFNKRQKIKSLEIFWSLAAAGGPSGCCPTESKSISLDQASPRLQASSIYLRIIENYIFETENYIWISHQKHYK